MPERVLATRTLFKGKVLTLRVDHVEAEDGNRGMREVIEHRGAVGVVCVDGDEIVLVRQYRHATEEELLEIPAGKVEVGEDPAITAARELIEEVGLKTNSLEHLATFYTTPGFSNEQFHLYFTNEVEPELGATDPGEIVTIERRPVSSLKKLITSGEVRDAKSLLGLALLALRSS